LAYLESVAQPRQLPPLVVQGLAKSQEIANAAGRWHEQNRRQIGQVRQKLSDQVGRLGAWIEAHGPEIAAILEALIELDHAAVRIELEWREAGLGYLVSPMGAVEKLALSLHATANEGLEVLDFAEAALADDQFLDDAIALLDQADVLSEPAREHLRHGLNHIRDREFMHAWPPLIIGLEGAFADVAVANHIAVRVDNHIYLAGDDGKPLPHKAPSVEGVARILGHSAAESDFGEFLVRQVYGGEGNPFRHGTARDGVRERSIALAIAVIGWLDAFVIPGSRDLLRKALVRELARRQDGDLAQLRAELPEGPA